MMLTKKKYLLIKWNNCYKIYSPFGQITNNHFFFKGKTICFENWIKNGIIYVKEICEEKGTIKSSSDIFETMYKRTNWIC